MLYKVSKDFVIDSRTRKTEQLKPEPHSHQLNEIYFLQSGTCDVWIEKKLYKLTTGSVLFVPSYMEHKYVYHDCSKVKRTVLYISTEQLNWYFKDEYKNELNNLFENPLLSLSKKSFSTVNSIFEKMLLEKLNIDNLSKPLTKSYFFEIIIFLMRHHKYNDEINQKTDLSNVAIGEIIHYIDDNYNKDLSLPMLAKKFGISESGLSKKIKAFTNTTFKEYLNNKRISAAQNMLISTNKSITEISELCGYNSSNFFGDTFKKNIGMSPSQYRKILSSN